MRKYIHYGHTSFDPKLFTNIQNGFYAKPEGGLWASNVNAKMGWKQWCEFSGFRECSENNSFTFSLIDSAKILLINSVECLLKLPEIESEKELKPSTWTLLNYELLAKKYDAIEVNISEDSRLDCALYGWDCDSIVITNPNIISIREGRTT